MRVYKLFDNEINSWGHKKYPPGTALVAFTPVTGALQWYIFPYIPADHHGFQQIVGDLFQLLLHQISYFQDPPSQVHRSLFHLIQDQKHGYPVKIDMN